MISFILPTHNRSEQLRRTLAALAALSLKEPGEVLVVDNGSAPPIAAPARLANGLSVRVLRQATNIGTAARNHAACEASGEWLVMLDDDSFPLDAGFTDVFADAPADVAAIGAEIMLPSGSREDGGLPEVFVGCGAAIRREAFLDMGGYDTTFHYYVEEYDLCAKLLRAGRRIVHDRAFRIMHLKIARGRDMNVILQRLVRNNGCVAMRYAPRPQEEIDRVLERYGRIARRENAVDGFRAGCIDLERAAPDQVRKPLTEAQYERFTGAAAVKAALAREPRLVEGATATVVSGGKNEWVVRHVLEELGVTVVDDEAVGSVAVIGTLSPGPMLDAAARRRDACTPWRLADSRAACGPSTIVRREFQHARATSPVTRA